MTIPVAQPLRIVDARALVNSITSFDITPPAQLTRLVQIADLLDGSSNAVPPQSVLSLTDTQLLSYTESVATHRAASIGNGNGYAHQEARQTVGDTAAVEVTNQLRDGGGIDTIITALRPLFDQAAGVLETGAQQFGITGNTTAAEIINLDDLDAHTIWRSIRENIRTLEAISKLRIDISRYLNVSPTVAESLASRGLNGMFDANVIFDYTICFATAGNWSSDGRYHLRGEPSEGIDWLRMASVGLHLNTPAEVRDLYAGLTIPEAVPLNLSMPA